MKALFIGGTGTISSAITSLVSKNPDWQLYLLGDKAHTVIFDNTKLKRAVPGYVPTVRYDQGLRKAVEQARKSLSASSI